MFGPCVTVWVNQHNWIPDFFLHLQRDIRSSACKPSFPHGSWGIQKMSSHLSVSCTIALGIDESMLYKTTARLWSIERSTSGWDRHWWQRAWQRQSTQIYMHLSSSFQVQTHHTIAEGSRGHEMLIIEEKYNNTWGKSPEQWKMHCSLTQSSYRNQAQRHAGLDF